MPTLCNDTTPAVPDKCIGKADKVEMWCMGQMWFCEYIGPAPYHNPTFVPTNFTCNSC